MHLKISSFTTGVFLAFSSLTFAGGMITEESPGNVTVPCQRSAFQLGIYGMYLLPSYSDQLSYLDSNTVLSNGATTATSQNVHVNEHWDWAGMVEGGYHFNCGNDVTVSWLYTQNSDNQTYNSSGLSFQNAPLIFLNFSYQNRENSKLTFYRLDAEMGQHVDFGEVKDIRFHGGFEYAHFEFTSRANGTGVSNSAITLAKSKSSKFNGIGPRIGMDLSYYVLDGLSIYGKSSIAALVGTTESQNMFAYVNPNTNNQTATFKDKRDNQIVPVIALKLGLKYTVSVYQNVYSLDAGYMWSDYIAIAHNLNPTIPSSQTSVGRPSDANFYLQGPYVGIRWLGQA